ncbi:MAG: hypothetical protein JRC87_02580 [Deltaproteobacteria bacterium]|nr:hypothetical protein [Deltaproteobacteria bacterium]
MASSLSIYSPFPGREGDCRLFLFLDCHGTAVLQPDTGKRPRSFLAAVLSIGIRL